MKKRQMTIEEYNTAGTHTIIINNARYQKGFLKAIEKIIEAFLADKEVFFGFYRTDGLNLTLEEQKTLENEIPAFFQKNGDMQNISEYLSVARSKLNYDCYNYIPFIFDYYLETIMFPSKVDWEIFKQHHSNYQEHRFEEIITNHFSEVLFFYFDSGDFLICFNPKMYSPREVRNMIELFFVV